MRVIGYIRVSTAEQAATSALEQQEARIRQAGATEILIDVESGRKDGRKQFQALLDKVKRGKVDRVVVTRLDRLGRSVGSLVKALELFEKHKVELKILDAPVDLNSSFGWFNLSQMAALAEFESRLLSERIKHGMNHLREKGKATGRVPFGYCRVEEKYHPNLNLHPCGLTYWQVARGFLEAFFEAGTLRGANQLMKDRYSETFTPNSLKGWLTNPVLQGHTVYGRWHNHTRPEKWDVRYNTHEPLITAEEFQKIQGILTFNRQQWGFNRATIAGKYPLSGQVYCAECRGKCYLAKSRGKNRYFFCRKSQEGTCESRKMVRYEVTIDAAIAALIQHAETIAQDLETPNPEEKPPRVLELEQQLAGLKAIPNPIEAIKLAIVQVDQELQQLLNADAPELPVIDTELRQQRLTVLGDADSWGLLPDTDKQDFFKELIDSVFIKDGAVESIEFRF